MAELDDKKLKLAIHKLKGIQNVATIMNMYFQPIDEMIKDKDYTFDEAINAKRSQEKYLQKYGAFTLNTTVRSIENLLNGLEDVI